MRTIQVRYGHGCEEEHKLQPVFNDSDEFMNFPVALIRKCDFRLLKQAADILDTFAWDSPACKSRVRAWQKKAAKKVRHAKRDW